MKMNLEWKPIEWKISTPFYNYLESLRVGVIRNFEKEQAKYGINQCLFKLIAF